MLVCAELSPRATAAASGKATAAAEKIAIGTDAGCQRLGKPSGVLVHGVRCRR